MKLDPTQASEQLSHLNATQQNAKKWKMGNDKLLKTFHFEDFMSAFAWMTKVAMYAEKMNHHPEWQNVYATVSVALTTHDVDGISELDFKIAHFMDRC